MVVLDLITGSHFVLQKQGQILGKSQSALGVKFMHHVIIVVGLFHLQFSLLPFRTHKVKTYQFPEQMCF